MVNLFAYMVLMATAEASYMIRTRMATWLTCSGLPTNPPVMALPPTSALMFALVVGGGTVQDVR